MANSIIHFLLFGLFFSLFEPDLDLRLRIAVSRSSGLAAFGAVSLPRGLPSFETGCFRLLQGRLRIAGFAFEGTTVFWCGIATEGITVFRSRMLPLIARAFANSGFAFEGTTVFWCGIATDGITVFQSRMLPLIARRRRDCLKLMLSAVCCDKFLTLWDLVSSVFEVSFWAKAFEP